MIRTAVCGVILSSGLFAAAAHASGPPSASIQLACTGKSGSQVALKWSNTTMKPFTMKCGPEGSMPASQQPGQIVLQGANSTIEVQTEGGIETSYVMTATVASQSPPLNNFITLQHYGSPSTTADQNGYSIKRTAGPNKYGEQNYRIKLADTRPRQVIVVAQSSGDRSGAQMALRWGHPNHDKHNYFKTWTVKAGPPQQMTFPLADQNSEFEIQTEGGEGTGYSLSIYFDKDPAKGDAASISIVHNKPNTEQQKGYTDVSFTAPDGTIYGEMNIAVSAPWLKDLTPPSPLSGWEGQVKVCNFVGPATLHLEAKLVTPASNAASGVTLMQGGNAENDPVTFTAQGATSVATFETRQNFYEAGTWQITSAQVTHVTGTLPGVPLSAALPGNLGSPVLDFTGGNCPTP